MVSQSCEKGMTNGARCFASDLSQCQSSRSWSVVGAQMQNCVSRKWHDMRVNCVSVLTLTSNEACIAADVRSATVSEMNAVSASLRRVKRSTHQTSAIDTSTGLHRWW